MTKLEKLQWTLTILSIICICSGLPLLLKGLLMKKTEHFDNWVKAISRWAGWAFLGLAFIVSVDYRELRFFIVWMGVVMIFEIVHCAITWRR